MLENIVIPQSIRYAYQKANTIESEEMKAVFGMHYVLVYHIVLCDKLVDICRCSIYGKYKG